MADAARRDRSLEQVAEIAARNNRMSSPIGRRPSDSTGQQLLLRCVHPLSSGFQTQLDEELEEKSLSLKQKVTISPPKSKQPTKRTMLVFSPKNLIVTPLVPRDFVTDGFCGFSPNKPFVEGI